ncbi:claudin domain-containing protein 1-like isoform X1 [Paramormyrops kingsleyae]|uniref:claudin domain-containing protein 1-like isoform X1 n=1 Tax=Paramormyrops kingsleyae TaxID=1676925 RepID=UPI003B96DF2F
MVDNRYATALVIGSVLSILATVYLSVAVGTQHWYQYRSPPAMGEANASELRAMQEEFMSSDFDEKTYSDTLFRLNGTMGLWWRCVLVPTHSHWYKEPDPKMVTECVSFTLPQQFMPKYREPGNHNSGEDLVRTYLWRCQFLLPLVSLGLVVLGGMIGICACLCRSLTPLLGIGVLHLLAGKKHLHSGHRVLLPGGDGSPAPGVSPAGWSRWESGLVSVPGAHLLPPAHDGRCLAGVGGSQSRTELLSHDRLQSGIAACGRNLYKMTAYRMACIIL